MTNTSQYTSRRLSMDCPCDGRSLSWKVREIDSCHLSFVPCVLTTVDRSTVWRSWVSESVPNWVRLSPNDSNRRTEMFRKLILKSPSLSHSGQSDPKWCKLWHLCGRLHMCWLTPPSHDESVSGRRCVYFPELYFRSVSLVVGTSYIFLTEHHTFFRE